MASKAYQPVIHQMQMSLVNEDWKTSPFLPSGWLYKKLIDTDTATYVSDEGRFFKSVKVKTRSSRLEEVNKARSFLNEKQEVSEIYRLVEIRSRDEGVKWKIQLTEQIVEQLMEQEGDQAFQCFSFCTQDKSSGGFGDPIDNEICGVREDGEVCGDVEACSYTSEGEACGDRNGGDSREGGSVDVKFTQVHSCC